VPDGNLWQIPFATLHDPDSRYLIESKALYYAPSLTGLLVMRQTGDRRRPVFEQRMRYGEPPFLLVGDPWLGPSGTAEVPLIGTSPAIPNTAAEVRTIAALPGVRARILTDKAATEETLRREAPGYPIIHLATHAFLKDANSMDSGIQPHHGIGARRGGQNMAGEGIRLVLGLVCGGSAEQPPVGLAGIR